MKMALKRTILVGMYLVRLALGEVILHEMFTEHSHKNGWLSNGYYNIQIT